MLTKKELEFAQRVANTLLKNSKILEDSWRRYQKATDNLIKKIMEKENGLPEEEIKAYIQIGNRMQLVRIGTEKGIDWELNVAIKELNDYAKMKGGTLYVEVRM